MLNENEIDAAVAKARGIANHLNETLAALSSVGIECASVIGVTPGYDERGVMRDISRVSLVLNFKAVTPT